MQLTIVGAGAIGGTIAAHMIRAGHDVLLCDTDVAHVKAINDDGLSIEGPVENFTVPAIAVTPDGLPNQIARAAVAVKSHHTAQAAELLRERLRPDGYVVSFQNGLTTDVIAQAVGRARVIASFVNFGADVLGPGRILQGNIGTFRVGEPDLHVITPRVRELVAALPYAEATENIMGFLWGKEAYGAMLWAGAVSDLSIAQSLEDPRWRSLMLAIAREVLAQAPVKPESFDGFDPADLDGSLARLVTFNRNSAKSHSGIYRDLMVRKRKTEVDDFVSDLAGPLTSYIGELIRAIEHGERTCEVANLELLATYERAERLGRPLKAVVQTLPAPRRHDNGPLHGVAVAIKDLVDVAGCPRGNGNPEAMAAAPARKDGAVVAALRSAGADVFATTSLLEYAAGATHPMVPETLNPYDLSRTAGGSSGGSAALVGAGVCDVAIGTDTGGSIRIPAHYCGTVGFKPSFGAIDVRGVQPLAPSLDHVGLIASDVATTARVFAAIAGARTGSAQPGPAATGPAQTSPAATSPAQTGPAATGRSQAGPPATGPAQTSPTQTGPAQTSPTQTGPAQTGPAQTCPAQTGPGDGGTGRLRVGILVSQLSDPALEPDVRAALDAAVDAVRGGAEIVEVDGSAFAEIDRCFDAVILFEAWQVHHHQAERAPSHYGPETLRLLRTASRVTLDDYQAAMVRRDELRGAANAAYRDVDMVLSPAAPFVAPATTPPIDTPEGEAEGMFTRAYNLTGAPAIVLPCGWSAGGLPIGLQLSSPTGTDTALLAGAAQVERLLAFQRRPPAIA